VALLGARGAKLPPVAVKMPDGSVDMRQPVELPGRFDQTCQSWDMSFKDTKTADYVVGVVLAALGGDRFVLDLVRDRMDLPRTLLEVRTLSGRWPNVIMKLVEDKANGPAVIQSLRHEIGGFIDVNPEGGKVSRAAAASPQLESGNWFLPHPKIAPWVDAFINELAAFPAGVNDDQVDAWSQGAKRLLTVASKPKPAPCYIPESRNQGERSWMV
jgi:predicted phage terminase large subunit-like protein